MYVLFQTKRAQGFIFQQKYFNVKIIALLFTKL
jgi:hypothetical protein